MNRTIILVLVLLSSISGLPCKTFSQSNSGTYLINDVTVIDGTGKPERPHMRVAVKDGRIESVEQLSANSKMPVGYKVIDGSGKFLIPGLWDVHVHLVNLDEVAIPVLPAYGITSVRDMGGNVAQFKSGGDYMGLVATPDGSFQVVWADSRSDYFQLYTSNIKVDPKSIL